MSRNISGIAKETKGLTLPIILAGPILRRVDRNQVCIWAAFSRSVDIKAEIFRFADLQKIDSDEKTQPIKINDNENGATVIGLGSANSLRLGENLHIALVIAHPIHETVNVRSEIGSNNAINGNTNATKGVDFPTDELLAYDVEVAYNDGSSRKIQRLRDLGLLHGKKSIVYRSYHQHERGNNDSDNDAKVSSLPTFFLRGQRAPLNILHGSCRKLHGKGEDCLAVADELISSSFDNLRKRPSALFLTGDQIYADDVSELLIQYLTQFGIRLIGYEEEINGIHKRLSEIGIGERQDLVRKYAKFTSDNASNHLLSFGEFSAMHLLAWNVENWPHTYPDFENIAHSKRNDLNKSRSEIMQLEKARKALPAIRRILANVPTYMICDDHEITDDWNITKEWYEDVKASTCGKQIVTNGLAAYWAFQAWGNDPNLFSESFIRIITKHLGKVDDLANFERAAFEDYLWNFHGWSFVAPINPSTIFLDCRTQRHYDSLDGPPQLLNEEELDTIKEALSSANYKKGSPLIVVSPTPVFGFDLAEELQKYLASKSSVYKWDLETWAANERGFVRFITFIIQVLGPRHCIFLSGDVHYGFTISATFTFLSQDNMGREEGTEREKYSSLHISQLTSSALKTTSVAKEFILSEVLGRTRQFFSSGHSVRIGWKDMSLKAQKLKEHKSTINSWQSTNNRILNDNVLNKNFGHTIVKPVSSSSGPPLKSPDWIESRSILKTSGSRIPLFVISDNNLGWITVETDKNRISHKLLTPTEMVVRFMKSSWKANDRNDIHK
jgi:hypothetical protein